MESTSKNIGTLWTIEEAARNMKVTKAKIEKAIRINTLPIRTFGNRTMLDPHDVKAWYDQR
jgi:excisionase family DNA binding protein